MLRFTHPPRRLYRGQVPSLAEPLQRHPQNLVNRWTVRDTRQVDLALALALALAPAPEMEKGSGLVDLDESACYAVVPRKKDSKAEKLGAKGAMRLACSNQGVCSFDALL